MRVTVKLYAGLGDYLPPDSTNHVTTVSITPGATIGRIMEQMQVPPARAHLVLLNGVYVKPEDRDSTPVADGDTVAMWPPVAGG
jgi:molybdopterin converting factor small subunit